MKPRLRMHPGLFLSKMGGCLILRGALNGAPMKHSSVARIAVVLGLIPLCANAYSTTVASATTLPMAENGDFTLQSETTSSVAKPSLDPRFYIHGGFGGMESTGGTYREVAVGLSLNLSAGIYLTHRWMLGAYYRDAYATNADMGLLGGSSYASDFYGVENEVALYQGDKNEFRLGAKVGRVKVSGVSTALWLPYATTKMTTWTMGPTFSYYHFFKPKFGIGVDASYLEVLGKDATITSPNGTHTAKASSFGVADIGFTLQFRFH